MNLRNLRIGTRLGLAFGTMLILLLAMAGANFTLDHLHQDKADAVKEVLDRKEGLNDEMRGMLAQMAVSMRNVMFEPDAAGVDKQAQHVAALRERFYQMLGQYRELPMNDEERVLLAEVEALDKEVETPFRKAVGFAKGGSFETSTQYVRDEIDPVQTKQAALMHKMLKMQAALVEKADQADAEAVALLEMMTLAQVAAELVLGVALAYFCTRSITAPVAAAVEAAKRVASGDLTVQLDTRGKDEPAQLLAAMQEMTARLRDIVGGVRGTANDVVKASESLSEGSLELSSRTEQQAASLEETAATMEQMTATVRHTAERAGEARSLGTSAQEVAESGGAAVAQVVNTMGSISKSVERIAEINGVVDSIAFQTNILALNAAVEAARAGDQGRGFAVVAGEVRRLAQRCTEAAKEIKGLVAEAVQHSSEGSKLVTQAGGTIAKVVANVQSMASMAAEIANASGEQSSGISQLNEAVASLDSATQQNATLVERSTQSAQELRERADNLLHAVSTFRLETSGG